MYRLIVLPRGPKMEAADEGKALANSPTAYRDATQLTGPMSMRQLAEALTRATGRPALDARNRDGYFKITLSFAPEGSREAGPYINVSAPGLAVAVQEQLGLKLEKGTEPIKMLVVDHADVTPSPN
jgi:uncharacterized protein (TIGR03435 family)